MRARFILTLVILLLSYSNASLASAQIMKRLHVYANIENEKFYNYRIEKFEFEKSNVEIASDYANNQLMSVRNDVIITTNVPNYFPAGYAIDVVDLSSVCVDTSGGVSAEDFANYYLDLVQLHNGDQILFDDFIDNKTYLWARKRFDITFEPFKTISLKNNRCSGYVVLRAGLNF